LGPDWIAHRGSVGGVKMAHKNLATLNLVDRTEVFGTYSFRTNGLAERIASRLGESSRIARFAPPCLTGPFGTTLVQLDLPGWLARGAPPDPELAPTSVERRGDEIRFAFGPLCFAYDRFGLRKLETSSDDQDFADA